MAEFQSYSPRVEVVGEVVAAFIAGFPAEVREQGLSILAKHGISDPQAGQFIPLQALLDCMKEIGEKHSSQMLLRVGEQIAANAKLPPNLDTLETCLASIDVAYHMNHRGGEIGHYTYKYEGVQNGLHRATMTCENPYPCAFDWGVIEGFAKRFKPKDCVDVVVRHSSDEQCRRKGHESCTYHVSWM
ncbi:MAG: hypothetical protein AB1473_05340 [Thermodesulfobacteriota bacterium]